MMIQVRINEEGALRNQRHAFSNRFTLVSELLQNARRAGASLIEIHHDAATQVLRVHDDGCGLGDFQKLLSLHESGWDAATCAEEQPFGVGFSKCLYAASRCIVASGNLRVDIDTEAALAKAMIEVEQVAEGVRGTCVELHGVDLPELAQHVETLCLGFPVPVWFNGQPLSRRFSAENLATMSRPMGDVHLVGTRSGEHTRDTMVFLQGFCVLKPTWCSYDKVNVVHLDSRQFMARLPDRDKLIDEDQQRKRIDAELSACWRQTLEVAKHQLPSTQFVETYYAAMRAWGHLDLMNDLDALPAALFDQVIGYPIQEDSGQREYVQPVATAPSRAEIESGAATLVALDWVNDDNAPRWMLAHARGHLVFDWVGLHANHWVQQQVLHLEDETIRVEAIDEEARAELEGRWVMPTVILCQAVRVHVGDDMAEIGDAGVCHEGVVYVPAGENSGDPVQQLSSFTDEHDQFLDGDMHADREALADLIRHLRSVDPVDTLDSLLGELRLGKYPLLHGKTFQVSVGVGSVPGHSVELMASAQAAEAGVGHATH